MIVEGRIPPPDKMNPALAEGPRQVVMKSIDKDPARRYQSAAEMIVALNTFERAMRPGQVPSIPLRRSSVRFRTPSRGTARRRRKGSA